MTEWRVESLLALSLACSSVVALVTCARGPQPSAEPTHSAAPQQGNTAPEQEAAPSAAPRDGEAPPSGSPERSRNPASRALVQGRGPLAPFWRSLAAMEDGQRSDPVRILWLGDSHTAADFMTGTLRQELQKRHGAAGAGFVRAGVTHYRHDATRLEVSGKWRRFPQQPSRRSAVLDGVFGLCGMRAVPEAGSFATVRLQSHGLEKGAPVRWTVVYRALGTAAIQVQLGARSVRLAAAGSPSDAAASELGRFVSAQDAPIRHFAMEGTAGDDLRIEHASGTPEVFGIFADHVGPGVVVDTCGIDGARIATLLAWDAEAWQAEVKARSPDLVVLAFGTNEAFDGGPVDRYLAEYRRVLERLRAAAPELPCWIVGPPDARDASGRAAERVVAVTEVQRRAAGELGCGFVSTRELMGGDGSFTAWRQASPPLAAADGVHLSGEGYRRLGAELVDALLPATPAAP